jgi:hypothetical protein
MNLKIMSYLLMVTGILVLAYSGNTFNTEHTVVSHSGVSAVVTRRHYLPPILGSVLVLVGVVLLAVKPRKLVGSTPVAS